MFILNFSVHSLVDWAIVEQNIDENEAATLLFTSELQPVQLHRP